MSNRKEPEVRFNFIRAMLTVHGVFNSCYLEEIFGVATAQARKVCGEFTKSNKGVAFDYQRLSYIANDDFRSMPEATEYLKAIHIVFGGSDYSHPGVKPARILKMNTERAA
ncbi:TPA: hypothetical protein ACQJXC_003579 [Raoultella ornithinolytica]